MPAQIFKRPEDQALFEQQGFLVVPFLDQEQVNFLDHTFDELHPELPAGGFVSGSYSSSFEYKQKASTIIATTFEKNFERIFQDYRAIGGAFLFKMPAEDSELVMHQDWTIVDEAKHWALNVWVPLTDITPENGALMVLPGTHFKNIETYRAPTMPFFFTGKETIAKEYLVPMYVKAGEAVILNQSLVHYSPPNRSTQIRKAITAGVLSKGAEMQFYYKDHSNTDHKLERFAMDDDFLIRFDNFHKDIFERPKNGQPAGYQEFKMPSYSEQDFRKLIEQKRMAAGFPIEKPNFINRLKSWWANR